jgi:hypothetical protein
MANPGNRGMGGFGEQQRGHEAGRGTGSTGTATRHEEQGVMGTVKDKASDLASGVASTAEQAWETTRQTAQNVASSVASTAGDAWDNVSSFMRNYPVATFFIGLGCGFLLAEMFTNRRS